MKLVYFQHKNLFIFIQFTTRYVKEETCGVINKKGIQESKNVTLPRQYISANERRCDFLKLFFKISCSLIIHPH